MRSVRSKRRHRLACILGVAALGIVAACGGDDDGGGASSAAPTAPATTGDGSSGPSSAPGTAGATTPDDAGDGDVAYDSEATITYAAGADIANFDPHRSAAGGTIVEYGTLIYAGLTDIDAEGQPIPDLATSWEFVEEDGASILRMELREGVTFHDGEPFDAEAAKANLDRAKTIEGSTVAAILAPIEEVRVTGAHSIDLVLTDIDVSLPAAFAHQAGRMLSPASFDDPAIDQHPISAGPYRVTQYLAGDQIQMERFDDYWDQESLEGAPKHFVYRIMPDAAARLAALRTGQIDATSLAPAQVAEAERLDLDVHVNPGLGYYVIWLNSSREQFQDVRVRQAMNIAIDREAITESVLFGNGIPTIQPFPPGYFAHNPDFPVDHYAYDPERARELLAEAGVPDGVSFEFMAFQLSPHYDIAQAVQAYWAEVGIDATVRIVDTAQVAVLFFGEKQSDVMLSTLGARPDPSMTIGYQFTSAGFGNPGGQSTPAIEELYVQSLRETDPDRRAEILQENVAEVVEQAFQVPIAAATYNYALSEDVTGFVGRAEGYIDLRDLRKLAD